MIHFYPKSRPSSASTANGSGDNDWTAGGADANWTTGGNWSKASAPVSGECVRFNADVDGPTTGFNESVILKDLLIGSAFRGTLDGKVSAETLIIDQRAGALSISGYFNQVFVQDAEESSTSLLFSGASTWLRRLHVIKAGYMEVRTAVQVDDLTVTPGLGQRANVTVRDNVGDGAGTTVGGIEVMANIRIGRGGYVTTASGATQADIFGEGQLTTSGDCRFSAIDANRSIHHRSSGSIGTLNLYPGAHLYAGDNPNSSFSISTPTTWPDSTLDVRNGLGAFAPGVNPITYYGGLFLVDEGTTIEMA